MSIFAGNFFLLLFSSTTLNHWIQTQKEMCAADLTCACTDQKSFARGGPTLTFLFFFFLGRHYKWAIISPPAKRHFNGILLARRSWPNIECWLGFLVFRGTGPVLLRNFIFFLFVRGGGGGGGGGGGSGPCVNIIVTQQSIHNGFQQPFEEEITDTFDPSHAPQLGGKGWGPKTKF